MTAMAIAGTAPTSTIDGKQNQSDRSDGPSEPSRIQSWIQPWPRVPSQTASVTAGSSKNLRLKLGTTVAKDARAAAMLVANAAICSMMNCGFRHLANCSASEARKAALGVGLAKPRAGSHLCLCRYAPPELSRALRSDSSLSRRAITP